MVAKGRCAVCGKTREGKSKTYCEKCRITRNIWTRERLRKKISAKKRYENAESYKIGGSK